MALLQPLGNFVDLANNLLISHDGISSLSVSASPPVIGVLRVVIQSAHIFKSRARFVGPPDPFLVLRLGSSSEVTLSENHLHTYDPNWMNRTNYMLVRSLADSFTLTLYDNHRWWRRTPRGSATFDLARLEEQHSQTVGLPLLHGIKEKAHILFSLTYHPVKPGDKNTCSSGVVRLILHKAEGLESNTSASHKLFPVARVGLGLDDVPVHTTQRCITATGNPLWSSSCEFLCTDRSSSTIVITVVDGTEQTDLGHLLMPLEDLLKGNGEGIFWWPLSGSRFGRIMISTEWRPVSVNL